MIGEPYGGPPLPTYEMAVKKVPNIPPFIREMARCMCPYLGMVDLYLHYAHVHHHASKMTGVSPNHGVQCRYPRPWSEPKCQYILGPRDRTVAQPSENGPKQTLSRVFRVHFCDHITWDILTSPP